MHELNDLAEWVRTEAIPILITGTAAVSELPPGIEISIGHSSLEEALVGARRETAFTLNATRVMARGLREDFAKNLVDASRGSLSAEAANRWLDGLGDAEMVERFDQIEPILDAPSALRAWRVVKSFAREALAASVEPDGDVKPETDA